MKKLTTSLFISRIINPRLGSLIFCTRSVLSMVILEKDVVKYSVRHQTQLINTGSVPKKIRFGVKIKGVKRYFEKEKTSSSKSKIFKPLCLYLLQVFIDKLDITKSGTGAQYICSLPIHHPSDKYLQSSTNLINVTSSVAITNAVHCLGMIWKNPKHVG